MSAIKIRIVVATVFVPGFLIGSASAQEVSSTQGFQEWAADVVRGEKSTSVHSDSGASAKTAADSMTVRFGKKGKELLAQVCALVEQRVGWLRPTSVKEQALIWLAIAMALPWGFVNWLRPVLKNDILIIRWAVVGVWMGIALWSAWSTWGMASGTDRFASTMLIGAPMLLIYFNSVVRSLAVPGKA